MASLDDANLQLNDALSNRVVHIKFCSAFSGISMIVRPRDFARSFSPTKRYGSSSPETSMKVACGEIYVLM